MGSGKTSAAAWEVCYYIPKFLYGQYKISRTKWVIVRNTYRELQDTTIQTIIEWFPWGKGGDVKEPKDYNLQYPDGFTVDLLFRSCDNPEDIKKFKSLEVTGYWIDESIEVDEKIKRMLKNRIGRYPKKCPVRFGIETTNPPDVEHPTYSQFSWDTPPPGPVTAIKPLKNHVGFWQPPHENDANLRPGYYTDLIEDYRDSPDWIATYIDSKPGIIMAGKLVYNNFKREHHVAVDSLIWNQGDLWRGWDNSGNSPACVVLQAPQARQYQVLREFHSDRMGMVDFGNYVKEECNKAFPGARYTEWADPAGEHQYSQKKGGFTSNAQLMRDECKINVMASEQNWQARKESVESQLARFDGLLIDSSCIRLINGFIGGYHYPEVGKTGTYAKDPEKNRFSHVHDALQYVMVKLVGSRVSTERLQERTISDWDPLGRDNLQAQAVMEA